SFFNADGTPATVRGNEPGFSSLAPNSAFLQTLNDDPARRHPETHYFAIAGTSRSFTFKMMNFFLGVSADDGLVTVTTATYTPAPPAIPTRPHAPATPPALPRSPPPPTQWRTPPPRKGRATFPPFKKNRSDRHNRMRGCSAGFSRRLKSRLSRFFGAGGGFSR